MSAPFAVRSVARSHIGAIRSINEDRILNVSDRGLWAVADGMGGHAMGDIAADIVVATLSDLAASAEVLSVATIKAALETANRRVLDLNGTSGRQSGSTVAGLYLTDGEAIIFWAGDSRVYRCRHGEITLLTHDHRLVQEMIDAGMINAQQARVHPRATVITRAIGANPMFNLATRVERVLEGDTYLMCSDGLSDLIDNRQLAAALSNPNDDAANRLVQSALAAGGTDNISFIMVALNVPGSRPWATVSSCVTRF